MSDTLTLSVPGMTCGHCEAAVKQEVGGVPGVASVAVDLETKDVVVAAAASIETPSWPPSMKPASMSPELGVVPGA